MFVKKVFQLVKPFLANLHSTSSNKYSYMYSMTPKFFCSFLLWVFKIRRILRWFLICGNNRKKIHPEKVICQTLLQVSSIEEKNLWFFTLVLAVTFLLAIFSRFSQQFWNQHKFCVVLIFKFCKEKVFMSY